MPTYNNNSRKETTLLVRGTFQEGSIFPEISIHCWCEVLGGKIVVRSSAIVVHISEKKKSKSAQPRILPVSGRF